MNRRHFLCSSLAALTGSRITNLTFAADAPQSRDHLLVVLFLRGGCDGLNLLGPANDKDYIAARPEWLRATDAGKFEGIALKNGYNGIDMRLHREAGALKELYDSGHLAMIHACGLKNGSRSHFEAQDMMERGVADQKNISIASGWLTRTIEALSPHGLLPAVAVGGELPDSLLHSKVAVSMSEARDFTYGRENQLALLKRLYAGSESIHRIGKLTLDTITALQSKMPRDGDGNVQDYKPEKGISYEDTGSLGESLRNLAQIAKMEAGLRVATVDYDGWDTHEGQEYRFNELVSEFSRALSSFYNDMSRFHSKMTVVVHTEFGRRLKSNQSDGTDHGYGGVHMVLGNGIKGGKLHGEWRGLANDQLDEGADLAITTDYRTVLTEVLTQRVGLADTKSIFPGFEMKKALGIV
ncbi:MAG: DUF1501 domain-containing protein [Verrucomicrobia bacterium]|nr:DUF1501 domain-containing protein [Verrucomicrobiota bacterium]